MKYLTWRGRMSWLYYRVREVFVTPALPEERCFMGAPIGPDIQCPRRADGLWCKRHDPAGLRSAEKPS